MYLIHCQCLTYLDAVGDAAPVSHAPPISSSSESCSNCGASDCCNGASENNSPSNKPTACSSKNYEQNEF